MEKILCLCLITTVVLALSNCSTGLAQSQPLQGGVRMGTYQNPKEASPSTEQSTQSYETPPSNVPTLTQMSPARGQSVKPLDPLLWKGNCFNKVAATALLQEPSKSYRLWKKIPRWQSGCWETSQSLTTRTIQYLNGSATSGRDPFQVYTCRFAETIGWQKDKNGDIWDQFGENYWTQKDYDNAIAFSYVKFRKPGEPDYPDGYLSYVDFFVDKQTKQIIRVAQRRAWQRFINAAPGIMKIESMGTQYNEKGEPTSSEWDTSIMRRIQTFNEYEPNLSRDPEIRADFIRYLSENGLQELVPDSSTPASEPK